MKILIACEFTGVMRRAFSARGHDVISCDLLPPLDNSPHHYQGDVLDLIEEGGQWDLMIAHPPCTFLCNSGVRWLYGGKGKIIDSARWTEMELAAQFFKWLREAPIAKICIENPIMHGHARDKIGGAPSQIIQPWQFGHGETKATCLWLKGLPLLKPTNIVSGRIPKVHFTSPGPHRWAERSATYPGIAAACAEQWG